MREDKLAAPVCLCHAQQDNHDDDDTGRGPVDADLINKVKILGAEDVDAHANQHDGPEAKHGLVCIGRPSFSPKTDGRKNELSPGEVDA